MLRAALGSSWTAPSVLTAFWSPSPLPCPINALNKQEKGSSLRGAGGCKFGSYRWEPLPPSLLLLFYFPGELRSFFPPSFFGWPSPTHPRSPPSAATTCARRGGGEGGGRGCWSRPIEFVSPSREALTNRVQPVRFFSSAFFRFQRFSTWPTRLDVASDAQA